jgi:outer membrane protein OmpA-like peptidoglycan-associated protein
MSTATKLGIPFEPAGAAELLDRFRVSQAAELALSGNSDSAESLLRELIQRPDAPVEALHLMAKICVQQGRVAEAGKLWQRAIESDPSNAACQAAVVRLNRMQRRPLWFTLLWPAVLASLVLAVFLFAWRIQSAHSHREFARLEGLISSKAPAPAASPAEQQPLPRPDLEVPGITVLPQSDHWMLRFDEGLFDRGVYFRRGAKPRLAGVFQALSASQEGLAVEVVGYSDGTPGLVPHADYIIGLKRAAAVAQFIGASSLFPAYRLSVSSGGSERPPFPGDSPQECAQNRTVVLVITRGEK